MAILVFQHAANDPIGLLGPILRNHAHVLDIRRLDKLGPAGIPSDLDNVSAVISLGGPMNVADGLAAGGPLWMNAEIDLIRAAHARQLPVLGICLGHQIIAHALGGEVGPADQSEVGFCKVTTNVAGHTDPVLAGIPWSTMQFQVHAQEVKKLPPDAIALMCSPACKVQAFRVGLRTYGFQFHFECSRADIDAFSRDAFTQQLMGKQGLSQADLKSLTDEHYDDYAGRSVRLCENIAAVMFPPLRKLRALRA